MVFRRGSRRMRPVARFRSGGKRGKPILLRNLFTGSSLDPNSANVTELVLAAGADFVADPFLTTPTGLRRAFISNVKFRAVLQPLVDISPAAEETTPVRFFWYLYILDSDEPPPDMQQAVFANEERILRGGVGGYAVAQSAMAVSTPLALQLPSHRVQFDIKTNFWLRSDEFLIWGVQAAANVDSYYTNPGLITATSQVSARPT